MFNVNYDTFAITMSTGDTGSVTYNLDGDTLGSDDRVLFTVQNSRSEIKIQKVLTPDNNNVTVEFENDDTDGLTPGNYTYDLRIVVDPVYAKDGTTIINGDEVITPMEPMPLILKGTVGRI